MYPHVCIHVCAYAHIRVHVEYGMEHVFTEIPVVPASQMSDAAWFTGFIDALGLYDVNPPGKSLWHFQVYVLLCRRRNYRNALTSQTEL